MRKSLAMSLVAVGLVSLSACGAQQAKWSAEAAEDAAYATQIPLYPGTKMVDAMGSESWGDEADSYSYGMTWWCETKATREQVLAWYEAKLPGAERSTPYEDGGVRLKLVPKGALPGEDMGVLIGEGGKYRVFESRKSKQIRRS